MDDQTDQPGPPPGTEHLVVGDACSRCGRYLSADTERAVEACAECEAWYRDAGLPIGQ